ncbi:MAG: ribonuclease P protein component [Patescibacteria group bacterium]
MLSKKNRISRKDFPASNVRGFRVFSPLFSLVVYTKSEGVHIAVVTSKKISKSAVVRNTLRRRLYALLEPQIKNLRSATVVVYPKQEALSSSPTVLRTELIKALQQSKLLS